MKKAPIPGNEVARQNRLDQFEILNSAPEKEFDDIVRLAAHIFGTPVGLVTLVDHERQWFKASLGLDFSQTPRSVSFCTHISKDEKTLVVSDARIDPRFSGNPLVTSGPMIRFYAGAVLRTNDGYDLGALCVIDTIPREVSEEQIRMLQLLADQVMRQMEVRLSNRRQRANLGELTASEEKFRQLADHIDGAFWLHEVAGHRVIYISSGCEKLYGVKREELFESSKAIYRVVHPEDLDFLKKVFRTAITEDFTFEYRIFAKGGVIKHIRERAFPIFDSEGVLRRICGIGTDVTEEKRRDRERDTQRAQMLQTSKLSALGEMSAGVAHEINNPITIILGMANRLRMIAERGPVESKMALETVEKIDATANRIAKIVHALLHFSRDGSHSPFQETSATRLLEEILPLCTARFAKHSVKLEVDTSAPESFACRPIELSQVILNLLNNAFDAISTRPNPWVRLEVHGEAEHVEFWVTDCGEGVPPEVRAKIFEPFFTTKELGKGTGLGLSLARGIVEKHGGKIWIDETCPHTRFRIRLPRRQAPDVKAA